MWVAFLIVVGVLAALLVVLALAALMPLRLEISLEKEADWRYRAALRPFGQYGPRIDLERREKKRPDKAKKSGAPEKKSAKSRLRPKRIIPAGLKLLSDILRRIRIRRVQLDARFGLGDPGETGQAFGLLAPVIYGVPSVPGIRLNIEPLFDGRASLSGRAELDISVVPASFVGPAIRFAWRAWGPGR